MKTKVIFTLMAALLFVLNACQEETLPPEVTIIELGVGENHGNDHTAIIGSDLHIEAEIVAEGTIDVVQVRVHPEGEHDEEDGHDGEHEEWELDTVYTKFSGLKNTTFHEHVDIDISAEPGEYHFDIVVTDMEGYQASAEADLEITAPNDDIAPEITISSAPGNNQTFSNGETINISGTVSDNKALGGMYIGLVREDQNLSDADVNATNTITLLHTHDFDSYTTHGFSSGITIGAAKDNNITPKDISGDIAWQSANYYVLVKCTDAFGGNWTISNRYPVVINY